MTQDTRKDRRVKIVSLNVRYKSATVDEFIENHSHDVSKGGIFIKTASPFPPGTLLKFEIRLSDDQSVIAGVGRVVWKRDGTIGSNERPSGMGVKFIKIDDPSKTVIDKLVSTKADAGKAFDAEPAAPDAVAAAATPAAAPVAPVAPVTAAAAATPSGAPKPMPAMQPTPAGGIAAPGGFARKQTMMGIGGIGEAAAAAARTAGASGGGGMFPVTNSQADMPPKQEQTVMKQAAELLEEALKEAGGSMDEIGHNPLFATGAGAIAQSEPPPALADSNATVADSPSAKAVMGGTTQPMKPARTSSPPVDALAREAQAAAAVAKKAESVPPTARESPSAKTTTVPPSRAGSFVETIAADKKKGNGAFIGVLVAVAAVAAGVYVFRDSIFPPPPAPTPTPVASVPAPPPPPSAVPSAAPNESASAAASASAAPSASASAAPTATAPATTTQPAATQAATAVPTARPTATQTATAAPTATQTAAPKPTATAAPTATATAAPKPTPKPKPTDDNPY